MFMHWPKPSSSGTEVPYGTFVTPPGQHRTCAGTYASLTRDYNCSLNHVDFSWNFKQKFIEIKIPLKSKYLEVLSLG